MNSFLRAPIPSISSDNSSINYIFIPAGSPDRIYGELKHDLVFNGKTSLENTLDAGIELGNKVIATVRNCSSIRKQYSSNENVKILEARDSLIDSSLYALMEGYINYFYKPNFTKNWANHRKVKAFLTENPSLEDLTILCVASDSPFISSKDLREFVQRYDALEEKPDVYVGLTNMEKLVELNSELELNISTLNSTLNNFCLTDKGLFRLSNMYILKPFKMLNAGIAGSLQKIYEHRKLSQGVTQYLGMLSGFNSILGKLIECPIASTIFFRDVKLASNHFRGNYIGREIKLDNAFKNTSKVTGLNISPDLECKLGPFLDIDDEMTYIFFREHEQRIYKYLQNK